MSLPSTARTPSCSAVSSSIPPSLLLSPPPPPPLPSHSPTIASSYAERLYFARRCHLPDAFPSSLSRPSDPTLATATALPPPMPRPNPPPTPASSSDIRAKEGPHDAPTFVLPPTAFPEADRASNSSSTPSNNGSDSSYRPLSPGTSTGNTRKRASQPHMSVITKEDFSLPPPPTRSRKIIQMKPREANPPETAQTAAAASTASGKASSGAAQSTGGKKNAAGGKNTTAAGRKIARKTAHSLIERRRRSKMNEEFGVLKDMIPACQGQDMHKLAILQAGIDYLRYLEQCVSDLQAQNNSPRPPPPLTRAPADDGLDSDDEMDETHDPEPQQPMPTTTATATTATATTQREPPAQPQRTSSIISLPSLSQMTTNSPSIFSTTAGGSRHYSVSSTSQASYSPYIHSNQASPAFGPQLSHIPYYNAPGFGLGSPALQPIDAAASYSSQSHYLRSVADGASAIITDQTSPEHREKSSRTAPNPRRPASSARSELELDQEATAALLMLNSDRRSWRGSGSGPGPGPGFSSRQPSDEGRKGSSGSGSSGGGGGGMSVRDLLSG